MTISHDKNARRHINTSSIMRRIGANCLITRRDVLNKVDLNRVRVINENSLHNVMRMICSKDSEHYETKTSVRNFSEKRVFVRTHYII